MNRLSPFKSSFILAAAVSLGAVPASGNPRKNVVLIVADDLGLQIGCYGDAVARTPGIDRLAESGVRFTHAYCTAASCSASRSVILTGLHNHANGQYGLAHAEYHFSSFETVRSLPLLMAEAGYRTCSIGKIHVAPEYVYKFEAYRNAETQGARHAVQMARNAKEWIEEKDPRPFFLYFCPTDPHRGGGPDGFSNFHAEPDRYPGATRVTFDPATVPVPPWLPDRPEVRQELAEYYQSISRMDQGVGRLIDALHDTGHWKDTLVLFLSDNGPPFPGAKTTLYEPGTRLPLIVRDPDVKPGVTQAHVSWVDLVPTILECCGISPGPGPAIRKTENVGRRMAEGQQPWTVHGRSFLKAMAQEQPGGWGEVTFSHSFHEITMYYPMRAILSGRHKYILNLAHELPYPFASDLYRSPTWQGVLKRKESQYGLRTVEAYVHRPRHELYDLEADPHELKNLAEDPAHRTVLESLQARLKDWQTRTGDPWVSKWDYE